MDRALAELEAEEEVGLFDLIAELMTHFKGWSYEYVMDMPVQRFWHFVDWLGKRRKRESQAREGNPMAGLQQKLDGED